MDLLNDHLHTIHKPIYELDPRLRSIFSEIFSSIFQEKISENAVGKTSAISSMHQC